MRTRRKATIQDLRRAIDCMPHATRTAMLEGIRANDIIVGAYANSHGICPMLAAHRAGGRTSFASFARAWDRFAFRDGGRRARPATPRELLVLRTLLEASLLDDQGPAPELGAAIADHRELVATRPRRRPGDPDRSRELRRRHGWSWLRPVRRYDDYELALEGLDAAPEAEPQPVR